MSCRLRRGLAGGCLHPRAWSSTMVRWGLCAHGWSVVDDLPWLAHRGQGNGSEGTVGPRTVMATPEGEGGTMVDQRGRFDLGFC